MDSSDVLILGGGFAGLACATALAESGARVTLLEKKPHLGGRAFSFRDPRTGETVDNGQHLFMGCYRRTRTFLRRIGTESLLHFPAKIRVDYADASGRRDSLRCPRWLPAPFHLAFGVAGLRGISWKDKTALWRLDRAMRGLRNGSNEHRNSLTPSPTVVGDLAKGSTTSRMVPAAHIGGREGRGEGDGSLDRVTVREWLNSLGQSRILQERLFDPIALGALNDLPERASALGFVQVLREIFYRDTESARLGLSSVGLSDLYTQQSKKYIEDRGGKVLLNKKIIELIGDEDCVREARAESGETFAAERIVSALPPWSLKPIQRPRKLDGPWTSWNATPIIGINLWLDRPVVEEPLVGLIGAEIHWVFNKTLLWNENLFKSPLSPGGRGLGRVGARHGASSPHPNLPPQGGKDSLQYLSLVISGAHQHVDKSPKELFELAQSDMSRCFLDFKKAKVDAWSVVKEPFATPSPVCGSDAWRPAHRSPIPNFYYAGDWTQTGLPATIESAVVSGHACAELILKSKAFASGLPA